MTNRVSPDRFDSLRASKINKMADCFLLVRHRPTADPLYETNKVNKINRMTVCFLLAKRRSRGRSTIVWVADAAHIVALDCFVARAPRNDGWVAADPTASVLLGAV